MSIGHCYEVYDHLLANAARLHDAKWLAEFLQPHCRYRRLGWRGSRLRIVQHPAEFAPFLIFMAAQRVRSYLEIGTSTGGSFFFADSYLRATVPDFERSVGCDRTSKLRDWDEYRARFERIEFRHVGSQDLSLAGETYDLAFIDARHLERWVLHDYEKVKPHCRFVAFHDIVLTNASVDKAWQRIKSRHARHWEFIETAIPPECRCGIGVVEINPAADAAAAR
ncbi:MAG: class I SAM-dependent methyltransferase [Verrucomicrobia bacterium]|nr:class I SAM-dependent methyltransferase [Verrucomicrobiota bacterium]